MQCSALMEESLCYKTIKVLYGYFLASVFFRVFIGSARAIYGISREIINSSESRRLFTSSCLACRSNARYFLLASILSILACYISAGLLISGEIRYLPILLFCATLVSIYLIKKGALKYAVSIYHSSYIFQLINKKI